VTISADNFDKLREHLASTIASNAQFFGEDGAVCILLPDRGFAVESMTLPGALEDMVDVLREYAADWHTRLRHALNHRDNEGLVKLVKLSSAEQLKEWLMAASGASSLADVGGNN